MKILIPYDLNDNAKKFGVTNSYIHFKKWLEKLGCEIISYNQNNKYINSAAYPLIFLENKNNFYNLFKNNIIFIKTVIKEKPDFVIVWDFNYNYLVFFLLRFFIKTKIIIHIHCMFNGIVYRKNIDNLFFKLIRIFDDQVITNSYFMSQNIDVKLKRGAKNIPYFYNSCDLESYQYQRKDIDKNHINIVFAWQLVSRKGLKEFIVIKNELLKRYPLLIFNVFWDGPDRDLLIDEVSIKHHWLVDNIVFNDFLKNQCDILLNPSINEPFAVINVEALKNNCFIVARNSGGNRECIINKKTGYVYDNIDEAIWYISSFIEWNIVFEKKQYNQILESFDYNVSSKKLYNYLTKFLHDSI